MKDHETVIPVEQKKGQINEPDTVAAGLPALVSSLSQVAKYMNPGDAFTTMRKLNQKGGFDCPGCAWPDPDDDRSSIGEYCENGVKAIAEEATRKSLSPEFFAKHTIADLDKMSAFELGKLGRIDQPYIKLKDANHFQPISWNDAFDKITVKLKSLSSPDEAVFYTSGKTTNEAAFTYQLMVRRYGTNNLPDCSNMCHESSGVGLGATLGIGKGSATLHDLHNADLIIIMGQNPGTNHPRMLSALEKCKQNGGRIVSVNPLKETGLLNFKHPQKPGKILFGGTKLSDLYLQLNINSDIYLLKAVMKKLVLADEETGNILDHKFIKEKTDGWEELRSSLLEVDLDLCCQATGLSHDEIEQITNMIIENKSMVICWAMGLTQHLNGAYNIQEVVNLLLMRGSIGKLGTGTCPVRGHSNVQGDRTMGIWHKPEKKFLQKLKNHYDFDPPAKEGVGVVEAIKAFHEGQTKFLMSMGGNLLTASPDTEFTGKALNKAEMIVSVSTKLNRTHLATENVSIILPCIGRSEKDGDQFVTVENSAGIVHQSKGVIPPFNQVIKSEVEIICSLAMHMFEDQTIPWDQFTKDYNNIRNDIAKIIPGFENFNTKIKKPSGFYLPNGTRDQNFDTDNGKAHFTVNPVPDCLIEDGEFAMMTIRSHDQFNTTIYGENDRYRGIKGMRRIVLMHKKDIKDLGLKSLQKVDLYSHFNGDERIAPEFKVVPYDIPRGNIATYFPEANSLVHIDAHDKKSMTPASKFVRVKIKA